MAKLRDFFFAVQESFYEDFTTWYRLAGMRVKKPKPLPAHNTWLCNRMDALIRTIDMGRWNPEDWETAVENYERQMIKQSKHLQVLIEVFIELKYNPKQIAYWIGFLADSNQGELRQKVLSTWDKIHYNNELVINDPNSTKEVKAKAEEENTVLLKLLNAHLKENLPRVEDVDGVIKSIARNKADQKKLDQIKTIFELDEETPIAHDEKVALIPTTTIKSSPRHQTKKKIRICDHEHP